MVNVYVLIEKIDFSILKLLFQIYAILNFSFEDEFLEIKDGNFLQISKQYCRLVLLLTNVKAARSA